LLKLKIRYLAALSEGAEKARVAAEVEEMINGIVLLKIPNELAWTMAIEGKNVDTIGK
jgi:superkiller protein 3